MKAEKEIDNLLKYYRKQVKQLEKEGYNMNAASWGYEEGVLSSGNDIKLLLAYIEELRNNK